MVGHMLVELLPMCKPLGLLALINPASALSRQIKGKTFYG